MTRLVFTLAIINGLCAAPAAAAYNVAASTAYINIWYNTTTTPPRGFVTRVNTAQGYTWYYRDPVTGETKTNNGDGSKDTTWGYDCTNFASQVLKVGGVVMSGHLGQGGTYIRVRELAAALKSIATVTKFTSPAGAPGNLAAGDIVIWDNTHATEVLSGRGSGVVLSAHSLDRKDGSLAYYFSNGHPYARAFHITGTTITAPTDTTPPAVTPRDSGARVIQQDGWASGYYFTAEVSDSGDGVDGFEVTKSTALLDRERELLFGQGSFIFADPTAYGASHTYSIDLNRVSDGTTVYIQAFDGAGNLTLKNFRLDRIAPTIAPFDANGAPMTVSSMTQVTVLGMDAASGIDQITLLKPDNTTSTQTFSGQLVAYAAFTSLSDGSYTAKVFDRAGGNTQAGFIISTSEPFSEAQDDKNAMIGNVIPSSRCIVVHATDTVSGIASISISGTGLSETMTYFCGVPAKSTDVYAGAFCNLTEYSTYTYTVTSCSGKQKAFPEITITTSTKGGSICATSPAGTFCGGAGVINDTQLRTWGARLRVCMSAISCGICNGGGFESIVTSPAGSPYCGDTCCRVVSWAAPLGNKSFSVTNTTDAAVNSDDGYYRFSIYNPINGDEGEVSVADLNSPKFKMDQGQSTSGTIDVAQIGQGYPTSSPDGVANVDSPFARLQLSLRSVLDYSLQLARRLLRASSPIYGYFGSDAVFNSTTTFTLAYVDTVNTDTTTVRIYMFDGVSWSSSGITNQSIAYSTTTNVITASGDIDRTGLYAALYQAQDSSAPVTTVSFEGATFNFDGALFVSTDAYVVLTATDPAVNGFASTVASVTYRLDPAIDSAFSIYSSSIPLSLGTHVFEYRSLDYAGNVEATKTSTFTVTAGTAFRASNTARVPGVLLNGFLGSGAQLEIESQAQNSLTLLISSVNPQGLVAVDNIGEVGIGVTPQANLNVGVSSIAVQLRAGNSTSAVTSNQIAFGYNGDYSMRHLLRTEHSTAAHGNKLDFLVWNTGAASTTTLASLNVLSLQGIATAGGGSFHVQPVGEPDAEVEVSNGLSTGGGTMQRLQWVLPSSRRFKTDIKELSAKDEDRALADVAGLKHARFRYKSRKDGGLVEDPAQPLRTGLIYEEAPDSIRDGKTALSTGDRLVNVELALKASIRRLEELQARYERLKARRNP